MQRGMGTHPDILNTLVGRVPNSEPQISKGEVHPTQVPQVSQWEGPPYPDTPSTPGRLCTPNLPGCWGTPNPLGHLKDKELETRNQLAARPSQEPASYHNWHKRKQNSPTSAQQALSSRPVARSISEPELCSPEHRAEGGGRRCTSGKHRG
jgi:hypothetical protein